MVKKSHKAKLARQADGGPGGPPQFAIHDGQATLSSSQPILPAREIDPPSADHINHQSGKTMTGPLNRSERTATADATNGQRSRRLVVIGSTEPADRKPSVKTLSERKARTVAEGSRPHTRDGTSIMASRSGDSPGTSKPFDGVAEASPRTLAHHKAPNHGNLGEQGQADQKAVEDTRTRGVPMVPVGQSVRGTPLRYTLGHCGSARLQPLGSGGLASLCIPDSRKTYLAGLDRLLCPPGREPAPLIGSSQQEKTEINIARSPFGDSTRTSGMSQGRRDGPNQSDRCEGTPRDKVVTCADTNLATPEKLAGPPSVHSRDSAGLSTYQNDVHEEGQPNADVRNWVSAVLDRIWDSHWDEKATSNACVNVNGTLTSAASTSAANQQCQHSSEGHISAGTVPPSDCDFDTYGNRMTDEQQLNRKTQRPVDFGDSVVVFTGSGLRVISARDVLHETGPPTWSRLPRRIDLSSGRHDPRVIGTYSQRALLYPPAVGVSRLDDSRGFIDARSKAVCGDRPLLHYFPSYDGYSYYQGMATAYQPMTTIPALMVNAERGGETSDKQRRGAGRERDGRSLREGFVPLPNTFTTDYISQDLESRQTRTGRGGGWARVPPTTMRPVGSSNPAPMESGPITGPPRGRLLQRPSDLTVESQGQKFARDVRDPQGFLGPGRGDSAARRFSGPAGVLPGGFFPSYPAGFPTQFPQSSSNWNVSSSELFTPGRLFHLNAGAPRLDQSSQLRRRISNTVKGSINRHSSSGDLPGQQDLVFRKSLSDSSQVRHPILAVGPLEAPGQQGTCEGVRQASCLQPSGDASTIVEGGTTMTSAAPTGEKSVESAHVPPILRWEGQPSYGGPSESRLAVENLRAVAAGGQLTSAPSGWDPVLIPHGSGDSSYGAGRPMDSIPAVKGSMPYTRGGVAPRPRISLLSSRIRRQWKEKNERHPWWIKSKPFRGEEPTVDVVLRESDTQSGDPHTIQLKDFADGVTQFRRLASEAAGSVKAEPAQEGTDATGFHTKEAVADGSTSLISRSHPPGAGDVVDRHESKKITPSSQVNPFQAIFAASPPPRFPLWSSSMAQSTHLPVTGVGSAPDTAQGKSAERQWQQKTRVLAQSEAVASRAPQGGSAVVWDGGFTAAGKSSTISADKGTSLGTPLAQETEESIWNVSADSLATCPICLFFYSTQRRHPGANLVISRLPLERGLLAVDTFDEKDVRRLTMARLRCHSARVKAALRRLRFRDNAEPS